ncbi:MAG: tetratricopeptide repeat protein [Nitrospiraceae bacterium]|nr:tetratricopeptide repeat protein [Nitrospiraceae bacterium]
MKKYLLDFLGRILGSRKPDISIKGTEKLDELPIDVENPVSTYIALAVLLREKGEFYKSLRILEELRKQRLSRQRMKVVLLNLALSYRSAGFLDRAEEVLREAIKRFPLEAVFFYQLAVIERAVGNLEESVNLLEKASNLDKTFRDELFYTKLLLANHYIDEGMVDKAFLIIRSVNPRFPSPFFYFVVSKLYYSIGDREKGFEKAISGMKVSPGQQYAFLNLIKNFDNLDLEKLSLIVDKVGMSFITGKMMVEHLIAEGRDNEAMHILEELSDKYPLDPDIKETLLRILWKQKKRKRVVEEIEGYLSLLKQRHKLFRCSSCGFETNKFSWLCDKCRQWETMELNIE